MKTKLLIGFSLLLTLNSFSQDRVKLMFYNLLHYPTTQPSRITNLEGILSDYQPDLFMVCELENATGSANILNSIQTQDGRYAACMYEDNQSTSSPLQQMAYYNTQKLTLTAEEVLPTTLRDINHYTFKLNTVDQAANPKYLDVFVTHLKAGQNSASAPNNETKRLNSVNVFTTALASVPTNHYVVFSGDFNLYSANEPAYQEILDVTNSIVMVDPIDRFGNWHNGSSFQDIHTQAVFSTADGNGHIGDGSWGGLDDRFDFIMLSENLQTDAEVYYKNNTYSAYGNNGNCYNKSVNDPVCSGTYSQTIRDYLFNFSDHLPVVLEIETTQTLTVSLENYTPNLISFTQGNLVTNQLVLNVNTHYLKNQNIYIYNQLGQQLFSIPVGTTKTLHINTSQLANGVYYTSTSKNQKSPLKFTKYN